MEDCMGFQDEFDRLPRLPQHGNSLRVYGKIASQWQEGGNNLHLVQAEFRGALKQRIGSIIPAKDCTVEIGAILMMGHHLGLVDARGGVLDDDLSRAIAWIKRERQIGEQKDAEESTSTPAPGERGMACTERAGIG